MTFRFNRNAFLASSIALAMLAGCASPMSPTNAPSNGAQTSANNPTPATQTTADALAVEQDMNDYATLAGQDYSTLAITADAGATVAASASPAASPAPSASPSAAPSVKPSASPSAQPTGEREGDREGDRGGFQMPFAKDFFKGHLPAQVKAKVEAHFAEVKAKAEARMAKRHGEKDAIGKATKAAKWVDNGDGTETKTVSFDVTKTINGQTSERKASVVITRQKDTKTVVSYKADFSETMPNGMSRTSHREKTLQADGSWSVAFHFEVTYKDGSKRVMDSTKTIAADGTVSGTGTMTYTDASGKVIKTETVTYTGQEGDEAANEGGSTVKPADDDDASPAPSASPSASASPTASASPVVSASPVASAAPSASPSASAAPSASPSVAPSASPSAPATGTL